MTESKAVSYGAATIVNAIATGKGAAFGIDLETKAFVELNNSGSIKAKIRNASREDTTLIKLCVRGVFDHFGVDYGAWVETESNIPIARGLKSSSAAANAVVLAVVDAVLKENPGLDKPSDLDMINLGVDAAVKARVTITGAFDDAAASFFGGFVVTDNIERRILRSGEMESLSVILFIPEEKIYTSEVDVGKTKLLRDGVELAWNEALNGNLFTALTLNGVLYAASLGQDPSVALAALDAGALAAGLCGKGPAVAALSRDDTNAVRAAWDSFDGSVIEAKTNNRHARILR
ncbi:MAG: shikimate kinase [Candidatus Altiarchaeota archaeon]|nr:shikimate kinase [Candidatus Altiarchaeota archaeon]